MLLFWARVKMNFMLLFAFIVGPGRGDGVDGVCALLLFEFAGAVCVPCCWCSCFFLMLVVVLLLLLCVFVVVGVGVRVRCGC